MNRELIAILDYLEQERGIDRSFMLGSIAEAIRNAASKSVHGSRRVDVEIDPKTGSVTIRCQKEVVEEVEFPAEEISLEEARETHLSCVVGDYIEAEVDPEEFGRIAVDAARRLILSKIQTAEVELIQREYKDREGQLVRGTVKQFLPRRGVIVNLGKIDGLLPLEEYPKTERYSVGDSVCALILCVADSDGSARVILSRNDDRFPLECFLEEVPEYRQGLISVERVCRHPGDRTKIAVASSTANIDPVGAFVGVLGARVKEVIKTLGEKVDLILYSDDPMILLQNALRPTEVKKFRVDESEKTIFIVVDDEAYPVVIGKRGVNLRLLEELLGYHLRVTKMTDYHLGYREELDRESAAVLQSNSPLLDAPLDLGDGGMVMGDLFHEASITTPRQLLSSVRTQLADSLQISLGEVDRVVEIVIGRIKGTTSISSSSVEQGSRKELTDDEIFGKNHPIEGE